MRPTLWDYERFHGMLLGPAASRRCIDSFNGRVLFCPFDYKRDSATFPSHGLSPWDFSRGGNCQSLLQWRRLTLFSYYFLVFASFTGLSTALGLTQVIEAREVKDSDSPLLGAQSSIAPHLELDGLILDYLVGLGGIPPPSSVKLVRKFEYNFNLPGTHVVMLHFKSLSSRGEIVKDGQGKDILHLVEVYEPSLNHQVLRASVVGGLMAALGAGLLAWRKRLG